MTFLFGLLTASAFWMVIVALWMRSMVRQRTTLLAPMRALVRALEAVGDGLARCHPPSALLAQYRVECAAIEREPSGTEIADAAIAGTRLALGLAVAIATEAQTGEELVRQIRAALADLHREGEAWKADA